MPRPVNRHLVRCHGANIYRAVCPSGRERYIVDDLFPLPDVLDISIYNRPGPIRVYGSLYTGRRWYRFSRGFIADNTPRVCPWVNDCGSTKGGMGENRIFPHKQAPDFKSSCRPFSLASGFSFASSLTQPLKASNGF